MDLFTKAKNMGVKSVKCLVIRQNGVQEKTNQQIITRQGQQNLRKAQHSTTIVSDDSKINAQ